MYPQPALCSKPGHDFLSAGGEVRLPGFQRILSRFEIITRLKNKGFEVWSGKNFLSEAGRPKSPLMASMSWPGLPPAEPLKSIPLCTVLVDQK